MPPGSADPWGTQARGLCPQLPLGHYSWRGGAVGRQLHVRASTDHGVGPAGSCRQPCFRKEAQRPPRAGHSRGHEWVCRREVRGPRRAQQVFCKERAVGQGQAWSCQCLAHPGGCGSWAPGGDVSAPLCRDVLSSVGVRRGIVVVSAEWGWRPSFPGGSGVEAQSLHPGDAPTDGGILTPTRPPWLWKEQLQALQLG